MTDYNDGKWHGWNGGECPVHTRSRVQWTRHIGVGYGDQPYQGEAPAFGVKWIADGDGPAITGFRVVKEHRDPRTFWAVGKHLHDTVDDAKSFLALLERDYPGCGYGDQKIVKMVEVLE